MNKKTYFYPFLLVLGIVIIISFVYVRNFADQQSDGVVSPAPTTTDVETGTKEIRESVNVFEDEQNRYSNPPLADQIVNKPLGTRYNFTRLPELGGTGGEVWYLSEHIDGPPWSTLKKFDQFGAVARALTSFSPDNRYLAFRTRWNYGIGEYDFRLMVFDLVSGETITVRPPPSMRDILQNEQSLYLENYEWQDNAIQMIWYPLTPEKVDDNIQLFRTVPKQLWQYDLEDKAYTSPLSPSVISTTDIEISQKEINERVDIFEGEQNMHSVPSLADAIVNEDTKKSYEFIRRSNEGEIAGNEKWLLIERTSEPPQETTKEFSSFGAAARALTSFSPDNRYLAFRTRWNMGVAKYAFNLMVFDLQGEVTIVVTKPEGKPGGFVYPESYEWKENNKMDIIVYTVKSQYISEEKKHNYYRITPKELWQYDLQTYEHTFLREIEE